MKICAWVKKMIGKRKLKLLQKSIDEEYGELSGGFITCPENKKYILFVGKYRYLSKELVFVVFKKTKKLARFVFLIDKHNPRICSSLGTLGYITKDGKEARTSYSLVRSFIKLSTEDCLTNFFEKGFYNDRNFRN